jgi:hypothetical protein
MIRASEPPMMDAATVDGRVQGSDAVFEAKFMLPWPLSEEAPAEKYMPQLQAQHVGGCGKPPSEIGFVV